MCLQHLPFYRIFVADARAPRDGKHVECVGHYDPIPGAAMARVVKLVCTRSWHMQLYFEC